MLGTIGASNVNSQIWKSLNMFFQRTSLPPPPPAKEGLWLGPPPFLQPTLFSSYSSHVLLKILALKELCNEIDQKIKQRDIKITTQNMKRRYKK